MSGSPDTKPNKFPPSLEISLAIREELKHAVDKRSPFHQIISSEIFAQVFSQRVELMRTLRHKRGAIIIDPVTDDSEGLGIRVSIVWTKKNDKSLEVLYDDKARIQLLQRWYMNLAKAMQQPNEKIAWSVATGVLIESTEALGITPEEEPRPGMLDITYRDDPVIQSQLDNMRRIAEIGEINNRDTLEEYLRSVWEIIGVVDDQTKRQMTDRSPDVIMGGVSNDSIHTW